MLFIYCFLRKDTNAYSKITTYKFLSEKRHVFKLLFFNFPYQTLLYQNHQKKFSRTSVILESSKDIFQVIHLFKNLKQSLFVKHFYFSKFYKIFSTNCYHPHYFRNFLISFFFFFDLEAHTNPIILMDCMLQALNLCISPFYMPSVRTNIKSFFTHIFCLKVVRDKFQSNWIF